MANNSISHRVFAPDAGSHITQDTTPAPSNPGPSLPSVSAPIPVSPPPPPPGDQTPKRKRGRPKGSTSKKPAETDTPGASTSTSAVDPAKQKRPVGRPRKDGLPAGSVPKKSGIKRQKVTDEPGHWGLVVPYPSTTPDEWRQLAQSRPPHDLIAALLTTFAAPNPTSTVGPTLEEAFKIHLQSLAPNPGLESSPSAHNIPSLYSILKTFWLPSSPAYFTMAASASNTRMAMEYRFLYWDPQPLVFNGIQCPFCPSYLLNNGRILSGPIKIYDIGKPFFIIGCEYVCTSPQCIGASSASPTEGRKFGSTDASIMNSLPKGLKDEFPAKLLYEDTDAGSGPNVWNWNAMGVSTTLWNLVIGALGMGIRKESIVHLVKSMQLGPPEIKYTEPKDENKTEKEDTPHTPVPTSSTKPTHPTPPQPFHSPQPPHNTPHTHHTPIQPYQPHMTRLQPRHSAVPHYTYSHYAYYPDQSTSSQQAPPRPTSASASAGATTTNASGTSPVRAGSGK